MSGVFLFLLYNQPRAYSPYFSNFLRNPAEWGLCGSGGFCFTLFLVHFSIYGAVLSRDSGRKPASVRGAGGIWSACSLRHPDKPKEGVRRTAERRQVFSYVLFFSLCVRRTPSFGLSVCSRKHCTSISRQPHARTPVFCVWRVITFFKEKSAFSLFEYQPFHFCCLFFSSLQSSSRIAIRMSSAYLPLSKMASLRIPSVLNPAF